MAAAARLPGNIGGEADFPPGLAKCCRCVESPAKWVDAHGGRIITSGLVKDWANERDDAECKP